MEHLDPIRHLLQSLHIPGTCIQISNERVVLAYNGDPLDAVLEQYKDDNLYFLANIPAEKRREVPHQRQVKDIDIPSKKYVVFDIDLRKLFLTHDRDTQDTKIIEAATCIMDRLAASDLWSQYRAVVHSGNGIHIYYTSATPVVVTPAQYASGYKAMASELEKLIHYPVDPACSNIARMIRLPGSTNQKGDVHVDVRILDDRRRHAHILTTIATYKHTTSDQTIRIDALISAITRDPIRELCDYFGVHLDRDNYVLIDGVKSSIRINVESNLVKRFSEKPGSGNFIHLYAALHSLSFIEAAREIATKYAHKELSLTPEYQKQDQMAQVQKYREQFFKEGYTPLTWNTVIMDRTFPVIKNYSYVVLAGETKSGKSTVAFDLALKNALAGRQMLYITLEMTGDQLKDNIARKVADITPTDERTFLRTGSYPPEKDAKFRAKRAELDAADKLVIMGKGYEEKLTIDDLVEKILTYKDVCGVIIDNMDKIDRRPGEKDDWEKQKSVSQALLSFTSTFHVPVILVHHLKKGMDGRTDMFRSTNALSGSGKISHDADMVLFVARAKDGDSGTFVDNQTFIRIMETREFEPCTHRLFFVAGTFVDDDPSHRIFSNAYVK